MPTPEEILGYFAKSGKQGDEATARNRPKKQRHEAASHAAQAGWANHKKKEKN